MQQGLENETVLEVIHQYTTSLEFVSLSFCGREWFLLRRSIIGETKTNLCNLSTALMAGGRLKISRRNRGWWERLMGRLKIPKMMAFFHLYLLIVNLYPWMSHDIYICPEDVIYLIQLNRSSVLTSVIESPPTKRQYALAIKVVSNMQSSSVFDMTSGVDWSNC